MEIVITDIQLVGFTASVLSFGILIGAAIGSFSVLSHLDKEKSE